MKKVLGVDVGGSGIKGCLVDVENCRPVTDRYRIATPLPATPKNIADTIKQIAVSFNWQGEIGVGFPATVVNGIVKTATNIDKEWIGLNAEKYFSDYMNCDVTVVNDADAAGMAEVLFNSNSNSKGIVILLTIGTGVGSSLISDGRLVPNTELGHIYLSNGLLAEKFVADSVRQNEDLTWEEWGSRMNIFLKELEKLFSPSLFIIGGGVSKKSDKFMHSITVDTKIEMAQQKNYAGMVGAAMIKGNTPRSLGL